MTATPKKYLGDLGAVRAGLWLDEERLTAYLEGAIKGFRGPAQIEQFDGGQSNPTYRLTTATGRYVLRYVPGRVFFDMSMPDLSRDERAALYDSMNATLARLHSLEPAKIGLAGFGKPGNYFTRQVSRWSRQYEATRSVDIPEMEKL